MALPKAFRTPEDFAAWLETHGASRNELVVRLFKVHARARGIGYQDALDVALCYGWIDGVRRGLDADSFTQRFTPRRPRSNWSAVNIRRANELIAEGRMRPPGLAAFQARDPAAKAPYSFEQPRSRLAPAFTKRLRAMPGAWAYWEGTTPSYRRVSTHWVMSAKREATRERRFDELLQCCTRGIPIPLLRRP